jgi:hypothetical protein
LWNVLLTQSSPLGSSHIWDAATTPSSDERLNAGETEAPDEADLTTIITSEALDAYFFTFLPTDDMEANVGYTGFFRFDNPMDNLYTITIDQEPDEGTEVYLEYELFGVTDYTGVCMSLNDAPSFGGMIVKKNESWSTQREPIPASQLHKGDNVIRFTSFPSASYGYTVRDLKLRMAKAGPVCERQIILSQPGEGIYYGNKAYVKGLVTGEGNSLATISCAGRQVSAVGGSFEILLDKPEGKGKKWKTTIQATFEDGEMITRELRFDKEASFDLLNDLQEPVSLDEQVAVPELSFELATAGARLAGQSQAVYETMDMSIRTLRSNDVLPAASGMINVTGNARGFRCLPHGTRFQQDITIEIPYTADIPIGYKPQDIFTYYFDEPSRRWVRIQRDSVDTERGVIISKVDHFTDFINGIIKVPEAPTTNAYTPTSIKDLQVANPMDGIPIFQPPTPNNMGTAELSYPILVPPGRNGMQPIINLTYSSEKVNSWLGLGWDINLPAITVETRWGVPRFDPELESETYLLNGSQLAILDTSGRFKEMSHRGVWESRKTDVRYFRRTEGAFDKIIRHGNMPSNYWWEVIAPDGTKYYYGKSITSDAVSSEILESAIDNVVHWPLTMIVDQYGNSIIYDYVVVQDYGPSGASVMGRQIYINKIYYTGRGSNPGEYSVEFTRMDKSKFERKDKIISGRRGLKEVTGDLLQKVEVWFQDSTLVRSYFFSYHTGDFGKTLLNGFALTDSIGHRILDSVIVQDPSSVQSYLNVETVPSGIIPYTFEYKNEDEPLQYFDNVANTITTYDVDAAGSLGFGFESNPTSLGGNQSVGSNLNLGFDVGIGFEALSKSNSIGGSGSGSWSKSIGLLTMADINGDNLPDKIYIDRESELLMYRLHYLHEGIHDFGEEDTIFNIDLFSESSTNTPSLGWEVQGQIGPVSGGINKNYNQANTSTTTFFTDVNGDGILDIAKFGLVYFNAPVKKEGVMHPSFSLVTNNTVWIGGSCDSISFSGTIPQDFTKPGIDTIYIVNDSGDITSYFDTLHPDSSFYPDLEAVRVWVAPYEGTVSIQGTIEISPDYQALRKSQFFLDGLRASIQVVDSVYLSDTLYPIGDSITQYSLTGIHIEAGDRIYFRTQSLAERIYDKVIWDPVVNYTYCDDFPVISGAKNADGLDVFSFRASEGFVLSDPMLLKFPIDGTVRLLNTIQYNGSPSDTVFLQIFHNDPDSLAWSDTLSSQISASYQSDRDSLPVLQGDSLWCLAYSKSNVDWQSLYWDFALEYIYTPDTNIGALIDSSDPGNPKASIRYDIVTNKYIYNRDVLPTCSFTPSSTLNATVNPVITLSGNMGVDTVYFTIKSAGNLEKRRIVSVDDDTAFSQGFNYTFIQGTEYYLDFWCDNPDLTDALTSAKCTINTNPYDCGLHSIYEDTLAIFGPLYQGWGQFCYNSIGTNPYSIVEDSLKPSKRFLDPNITIIVDTGNILHCDSQLAAGAHYSPWTENFNVLFADPLNKFYGCLNVVSVDTFSQQHFSEFGFEEGISITHSPFPAVSSEMAVSIFPYSRNEFKTSSSSAGAFTVGYGKSETEGNIYNRSDFLDLNGDRYPDIFWRGRVIYSKPQGGLSKGVFGTNTPSRATQQTFYTAEGTSYLGSDILGEKNGRDKPQLTIRATGSLAIDGAEGESYDVFKMIDINGDGLLDKVKGDGHLSMNIGYNSLNYEDWNVDDVYHNVSDNFTLGGSVGASGITTAMADYLGEQKEYQKDGYSLALGLGGNWGKAFTDATFIDINGDGLVDRIRDNITAPGSGDCAIEINSGMGYETPVTASGLKSAHFSKSINTYVNGAGTIGVAIPIPFIGAIKFVMNGQGGKSWNVSQEKEQLIDINADGLPDYVYSDKVDEINVRYNTCGKRNFLLRIHNPGLSSIHLDYELSEHIWDNPDRSYLLTEIKTSDGFEGDGPDYKTAIVEYGNGRYDRYEREFLGYDTVRVTDYDSLSLGYVAPYRVSEVHYYNHNILFRGQKFYDVTKAGDGTIFAENYYDVKLTEILSGDSIPGGLLFCYGDGYPAIHSQQSTFTEGLSSTHITQIQEFDYGPFGNIEGFYQGGDETLLSDDYYTEIYYHSDTTKYIVSVADSIVVKDHSSNVLRKRAATINVQGKPTQIRSYNLSVVSNTDLDYDTNGLLKRIVYPPNDINQRYSLRYDYDSITQSYLLIGAYNSLDN